MWQKWWNGSRLGKEYATNKKDTTYSPYEIILQKQQHWQLYQFALRYAELPNGDILKKDIFRRRILLTKIVY